AIRASFDTQAYRYADDGRYYTAERFADYYKSGGDWVAKWTNSPVAQKVAEDGKAYSASQFKEFFKEGWLPLSYAPTDEMWLAGPFQQRSKWNAATWATQRRVTEPDGKVYTLDEFASYFKSEWQQKLGPFTLDLRIHVYNTHINLPPPREWRPSSCCESFEDDAVTMQSGISEARDPEAELSSWLMEVGLSYEDAGWWAQKESWYLKTCGATLPYLKKLYQELTGGLALPKGDAIPKMFDYAKKALDPAQLSNMFWVLHDCNVEKGLCLYKEEALSRAPGLLEMGTSSTELLKLYNFLTDDIERPKKEAMEVAAAGCEADKYWSAYQATHHKLAALDEAVRTSFEMQAFRYAVDGRPYTASLFKGHYGSNWLEKWTASPAAQKVAEDGKAYSVPQFWEYFKDDWSKWHEAKWATQRRIAEDGTVYTLEEFAEHYKSQWQQKWADAPVALCKECTAASHSP
ncbi:unnamed protein product, partial [Symbiodinium microadriaticum]